MPQVSHPPVQSTADHVKPKAATPAEAQAGVGGWLALLTAGLLVVRPLFGTGRIVADILTLESENPALKSVAQWANFKATSSFALLMFASISVYAGWGLARGRTWRVVRRAQFALWMVGPVAAIVHDVIVPVATLRSVVGFDVKLTPAMMTGLATSVFLAAMWNLYLVKSRRVRATYAPDLQRGQRRDHKTELASERDQRTKCGRGDSNPHWIAPTSS